jgi:hypothetical protein
MRRSSILFASIGITVLLGTENLEAAAAATITEFTGACDASAVVPLDHRLFAMADDEDSILRVYARDQGGAPVQTIDLSKFLVLGSRRGETDLEDAARIGELVFWISSHGRNGNISPAVIGFLRRQLRLATGSSMSVRWAGLILRCLMICSGILG